MSKSAPITITSEELRERVEEILDRWIPEDIWRAAEQYARYKLERYRIRWPEREYFDSEYLVELAADTVSELEMSRRTLVTAKIGG